VEAGGLALETESELGPPVADVQRRTLRTLFVTQVLGGLANAIGLSIGALLAADLVGVAGSGFALSAGVIGGALFTIPATRLVRSRGRRPSLAGAYALAALGAAVVYGSYVTRSAPLLFAGFFFFGGGWTAGLQARYAAVDLAPAAARARHLAWVVWATTLGSVAGPNLAPVVGTVLAPWGVPPLAAPFVLSAALFALVALAVALLLQPDPFVYARQHRERGASDTAPPHADAHGLRAALRAIPSLPGARLGMAAVVVGHTVMVGVMSMTPVHIRDAGHDAAATLRIVGIVLSVHIAGMYALAPLTGWMADHFGRRPVILGATVALLLACTVAGTAGHGTTQLAVGLTLLGLGWSGTLVAGSTLLSESVPPALRPSAQGLADLTMGLAAATAGALAGPIVQFAAYPALTLIAAVATLPLALLALRSLEPLRH
jgi:MFS family permease